ncbi:hypothetical protein LH427_07795 [Laribacter hongkongensis]|uniref:hypothetical protein n=1 Tax=Laribacter hongkongensis TaxID=168471 RepID=UPI001EFD6EB9|nr:hypothetical protein [Laribacter hongkongensis]MCG8993331.1 hypothetical protein [Laribacter hongkongensis]MCG8997689.1 hypothetical protein [Laribacter hongkongensis]MCG9001444.1 hypothetical protein [Laribacter hongkongensis]MCG9004601.1 hypothetical protein [Laribacter hongkongensis]MCG9007493.1 hypothetical protein [Laribacter hongkongensis]
MPSDYKLAANPDLIIRLADNYAIPRGHRWWADYEAWLDAGNVPEPAEPAASRDDLVRQIDDRAATIYNRWTRFEAEYRAREAAAQAFKDAGYQGDPGLYVTSFAEPAGLTARAAADAILAQAAALRAAQDALAGLRMRKYEVARASDVAVAQTLTDEIVAAMDGIAKGIT